MRIIATLSIILALGGCATAYEPNGWSGGFAESQLDTNVFNITFKGNEYTDREKANDYALLRSAEVALQNGYQYFVIIDAQEYSEDSTYVTPTTSTTNAHSNASGAAYDIGDVTIYNGNRNGTSTTTVSGGQTYDISKPRTSNTIVCYNDKPAGFSYNAQLVATSLKQKRGI
jgi:hypothetical protein